VTSLLIVDDQELVRTGLRMILAAEHDLTVAGEAGDGIEAIAAVRELRPDIVLMDVQMPRMNGLEATRRLLGPGVAHPPRVVILTTFDRSELVYEALLAGASGFLLKDMPGGHLVTGVRAVARGEELLAPQITRRLIESFVRVGRTPVPAGYERLTPRERDVLALVARGLSNAEIAAGLVLSEATIKTHVAHLLAKLDLRDRVQAVVLAYETGLVRAGDGTVEQARGPLGTSAP
jgi:DNA-binding NarL/FixJ family response regulator